MEKIRQDIDKKQRLSEERFNELIANKKYLRILINEYTRLYKNVTIGQDLDKLEGLEDN